MIIRATQEIIRAIRQMICTIVRMVFAWITWNSFTSTSRNLRRVQWALRDSYNTVWSGLCEC